MGGSKRYGLNKAVKPRSVFVRVTTGGDIWPGLAVEWRKRLDRNGYPEWWVRVIYLVGDDPNRNVIERWVQLVQVKPAPYAEADDPY